MTLPKTPGLDRDADPAYLKGLKRLKMTDAISYSGGAGAARRGGSGYFLAGVAVALEVS